jgi:DNA-binding transcriptional LysR family regulator
MSKNARERKLEGKRPCDGSVRKQLVRPGLNPRSLEIFLAVARAGSMSAAAEELNLTQPAVSQAIATLEDAIEVELFDRSVRPPALTLRGAALLSHAAEVVRSLGGFEHALRLGQSAPLPLLRIGMLNSFAAALGPFVIDRSRDLATEWQVRSGFDATRIQALLERRSDLLITADEAPVPPGVEVIPLLSEPFLIIVPASYGGSTDPLKPLTEDLDLVWFGRDQHMRSRLDRCLLNMEIVPQRKYHLDTSEAVIQMVAAGLGWTILPSLTVFRAMSNGVSVRAAPFPGEAVMRTVMIVARRGEGSHVARTIRDAAVEALRSIFMPEVTRLLPAFADSIRLHPACETWSGNHFDR